MTFLRWIAQYWKAITAALIAGAGVTITALANDGRVDGTESIIIFVAVLSGGTVVWRVPNKPMLTARRTPSA